MKIASLAEMLNDFNSGTFDLTENGKCTECGSCCGVYLPLTEKEIATIRKYINEHHIKECKHGSGIPLAEPVLDMCCPFLDDSKKTHKCTIYPVRGKVCEDFTCCPSKRQPIDVEHAVETKIVNVRETFFGK
jgi:Fe-S-cluster containining protein